jgi:hypothetical protein
MFQLESIQPPLVPHFTIKNILLCCIANVNNFFIFYLYLQNLIDLAGSESSKAETTGVRRKEGSYINKSLLTLGTVRLQTLCWSSIFGIQSAMRFLIIFVIIIINIGLNFFCFDYLLCELSVVPLLCYYYIMFVSSKEPVYYVSGS